MEFNINVHMKGEAAMFTLLQQIIRRLDDIETEIEDINGRVSCEDQKLLDQLSARAARIVAKLEKLDARTPVVKASVV